MTHALVMMIVTNELSPRDLKLLLDEYNDMIKKLKSKLKCLKIVHVELKTSHDELLVRHNEVVETNEK